MSLRPGLTEAITAVLDTLHNDIVSQFQVSFVSSLTRDSPADSSRSQTITE
jgi:hypothetical protein